MEFQQVAQRHAKLTTGRLSRESPTDPSRRATSQSGLTEQERLDRTVEELVQDVRSLCIQEPVTPPLPLSITFRAAEGMPDDTQVVERPAWQAFVLMIQLHNLERAAEIDPAHQLGTHTHPRVALTVDGIAMLNYFIDSWYGKEVEIVTVLHARQGDTGGGGEDMATYGYPYRPVTGLRVIVTTTEQASPDPYHQYVLGEREKWGWADGISSLEAARNLYVKERIKYTRVDSRKRNGDDERAGRWGTIKRRFSKKNSADGVWVRKR